MKNKNSVEYIRKRIELLDEMIFSKSETKYLMRDIIYYIVDLVEEVEERSLVNKYDIDSDRIHELERKIERYEKRLTNLGIDFNNHKHNIEGHRDSSYPTINGIEMMYLDKHNCDKEPRKPLGKNASVSECGSNPVEKRRNRNKELVDFYSKIFELGIDKGDKDCE